MSRPDRTPKRRAPLRMYEYEHVTSLRQEEREERPGFQRCRPNPERRDEQIDYDTETRNHETLFKHVGVIDKDRPKCGQQTAAIDERREGL